MTDYYQTRAAEYFRRTVSIDPAAFLSDFVRLLPPGATVLDIGCGSGRDLLWLKQQGFLCTGLEQSRELARLAAAHSGCPVMARDFETFDFSRSRFDAILAAGSLVHIPHPRLARVIRHVKSALAPNGLFYISLKQGHGETTDPLGRCFYYWQDDDLSPLFAALGLDSLFFSRIPSALDPADQWLTYVLRAG